MRLHKLIIIVIVIAGILFLAYMLQTRQANQVTTTTQISGARAEFKSNAFLQTTLSDLDFYKKHKVDDIEMILSDQPQAVEVGKRTNDRGEVVTASSYTVERVDNKIAKYTLYVNPELYPSSNKEELERQYTQLALIAVFETTEREKSGESHVRQLKMLTEYRKNQQGNSLFSIQ